MFRPYKILFFFSCILAISPNLKCLVLLTIIDANGFVSTVDPTSNNELSGNQTTPQTDGPAGEENNDNKQPPNLANLQRLLSGPERKAILRAIGQNSGNQSRAQIEQRIQGILANNSVGALSAFNNWLQQTREWRQGRVSAVASELSDDEAKQFLNRIWAVLADRSLSLVESCGRVNRLLGRPEGQGCEPFLTWAADVDLDTDLGTDAPNLEERTSTVPMVKQRNGGEEEAEEDHLTEMEESPEDMPHLL